MASTKSRTERKGELIGIQVDAAMKRKLEDVARERDVPMSQLVRQALKQYLEKVA